MINHCSQLPTVLYPPALSNFVLNRVGHSSPPGGNYSQGYENSVQADFLPGAGWKQAGERWCPKPGSRQSGFADPALIPRTPSASLVRPPARHRGSSHLSAHEIHPVRGSFGPGPQGMPAHCTHRATRDGLWQSPVPTRSSLQFGNTTQRRRGVYTLSRLSPYSEGAAACA